MEIKKQPPRPARLRSLLLLAAVLWTLSAARLQAESVVYRVVERPKLPCVLHVIEVSRKAQDLSLVSAHAHGKAVGLSPVSEQARTITNGTPIAAINADFYERAGDFGGAPRGLQIIEGELLSAPSGGPTLWIDAEGRPRAEPMTSQLKALLPNGTRIAIGLNAYRPEDGAALYTPRFGPSTLTATGWELDLDPSSFPLAPQAAFASVIRAVRGPNSPIPSNGFVLSVGPQSGVSANPEVGAEVLITTVTQPSVKGARAAISGGPLLVVDGKPQKFKAAESDSYELSTMIERHPRSAFGWNDESYFFVAADGRQPGRSMGMTLDQLAAFMSEIGCTTAINFDGGGSSTLWHDGKVRNFLCDGYERDVANSLVLVRTTAK